MKLTDELRFDNGHYAVDFDHHAQPRFNSPNSQVRVYDSGVVSIHMAGDNRPEWRQSISSLTRGTCAVLMVKEAGNLYTPEGGKVVKKYLKAQLLQRQYRYPPKVETTEGFNLWLDYDHNIVLPMPGYKTHIAYPCEGARPVTDSHTGFVVRKPDRKAVKEHMKLLQPRIDLARVVYEMTEDNKRRISAMSVGYGESMRKRLLFDFEAELSHPEFMRLYISHLNGDLAQDLHNTFMTSQVVPFLRIKE